MAMYAHSIYMFLEKLIEKNIFQWNQFMCQTGFISLLSIFFRRFHFGLMVAAFLQCQHNMNLVWQMFCYHFATAYRIGITLSYSYIYTKESFNNMTSSWILLLVCYFFTLFLSPKYKDKISEWWQTIINGLLSAVRSKKLIRFKL